MLHSMTGFARESVETELGTLTWEIRAVNHRYLDVQFKLPEDLRPKEQAFRQQASAVLGRGKVECGLYFRRADDQQSEMQIDTELVELLGARIVRNFRKSCRKLPRSTRWKYCAGRASCSKPEIDAEPLFEQATVLLTTALAAMNEDAIE